jgi:uncharacterized protein
MRDDRMNGPARRLRRTALGLGVVAAGLLPLPGGANAASFPCRDAAAADERAICATPDLNDQDVRLATEYGMLLRLLPMGGAGALRDGQRQWLAERRDCGGDVACLEGAYAARLRALDAVFQGIVAGGPY